MKLKMASEAELLVRATSHVSEVEFQVVYLVPTARSMAPADPDLGHWLQWEHFRQWPEVASPVVPSVQEPWMSQLGPLRTQMTLTEAASSLLLPLASAPPSRAVSPVAAAMPWALGHLVQMVEIFLLLVLKLLSELLLQMELLGLQVARQQRLH